MRLRANSHCDGAGQLAEWYGFSEDVHDGKQASVGLAEQETRLLAIINSVDSLIWTSRPDGVHD